MGRLRPVLLGEYEKARFSRMTQFESWNGAPFNATPENNINRVTRRTYVTEGDWASYYVSGPASTGLLTNVTDPIGGRTLSARWITGNTSADDDPQEQRSGLLGLQASWFENRVIASGGYRYDKVFSDDRGTRRNPVTNEWEVDYASINRIESAGRTRTLGLVWHAHKHVSLLYNQANNIALANRRIRILPRGIQGPPTRGEGRDFGVALDLLEGRLYARAVRFETSSEGEIGFQFGNIGTGANQPILDALRRDPDGAGPLQPYITQAEADARAIPANNGSAYDRESDGYEFSLTANPTSNWRLQLNYSLTNGVETNIAPEVIAYWDEAKPYFLSFPQNLQTTGVLTIADEIRELQDLIDNQKSVEGIGLIGNRKHKASVVARYSFTERGLKGAFIGGGYRYQGRMLTGRSTDGTDVLQYAPPVGEVNAFVGYRIPLKGKHRLSVQLNVTNLFDETDPIITRYFGTGNLSQVRRVILREPRVWRLTVNYSL